MKNKLLCIFIVGFVCRLNAMEDARKYEADLAFLKKFNRKVIGESYNEERQKIYFARFENKTHIIEQSSESDNDEIDDNFQLPDLNFSLVDKEDFCRWIEKLNNVYHPGRRPANDESALSKALWLETQTWWPLEKSAYCVEDQPKYRTWIIDPQRNRLKRKAVLTHFRKDTIFMRIQELSDREGLVCIFDGHGGGDILITRLRSEAF